MPDPLWIDASAGAPEYSAAELRRDMAWAVMYDGRLVGGRPGVRPGGTQLKVTLAGSTITVDMGVAIVDPAWTTPAGPYWAALGAQETHTLTAADATNPRKDIVVLRVWDHAEDGGSGLRKAESQYIAGTPAPSPAEPAVPAGAFKLALIDVPAQGGGSPVVTDTRVWTVAPGGILPVNVAADISAAAAGRYRHRLDTHALERDTGAAWVPVGGPPNVQAFTASGTWTKPAGARTLHGRLKGAGAAGGGAEAGTAGQSDVGSGGGGGEYVEWWADASLYASTESVTIGAGGTGVSAANGNNGGDSQFSSGGTAIVAKGGSGGIKRAAPSATAHGSVGGAGGTGGTGGPTATVRVPGRSGGWAWADAALGVSGKGASGEFGAGGIEARTINQPNQVTGSAGLGRGSGGGGGIVAGAGSSVAGGAGTGGYCIIETYF